MKLSYADLESKLNQLEEKLSNINIGDSIIFSKEMFLQISQTINDAFIVCDLKNNVQFISPKFEVVYERPLDFFSKFPDDLFSHIADGNSKEYIKKLTNAQKNKLESFHLEYAILTPSGKTKWIWCRTKILYNEKKEPALFLTVLTDATNIKHFETALLSTSLTYQGIFNAATEAIIVINSDTNAIVDVNQAMLNMFGYTYEEALKLNPGNISANTSEFSNEKAEKLISNVNPDQPVTFEWKSKRKNGELFWTENVAKMAVLDGQDRLIVAARDINERKQNEAELDKYRKQLEQLVSERTSELEQANKKLEASNFQLNDANEQLNMLNEQLIEVIGKKKQAEKILAESEKKFRGFIEQSSEGILLITDKDTIVEWNKAMENITGYTKDEIINTESWRLEKLISTNKKTIQLSDEDAKKYQLKKIKNLQKGDFFNFTGPIKDKNGTIKHVSVSEFAIITDDHKFIGRITRDISQIKQLEEDLKLIYVDLKAKNEELESINEQLNASNEKLAAEIENKIAAQNELSQSEELLSSFINQSSEGIALINEEGQYLIWNAQQEKLFKITAEKIIGKTILDAEYKLFAELEFKSIDEFKEAIQGFLKAKKKRSVYSFERQNAKKNGETRDILVNVFPIKTKLGNYFASISRDISAQKNAERILQNQNSALEKTLHKLKKAQAQLVEAEKMVSIGTLTAGIVHEINNPVNFISSNVQGLKSHLKEIISKANDITSKEIFEIFDNIEAGVQKVTGITKSLKNFSRSGGEESIVNINEILNSTLTILYHQYKNRIDIQKRYSPRAYCQCFPEKISQVFLNLLSNSIQAIDHKGKITIETNIDESKGLLQINITDDGCGIPSNKISAVFEPFYTTKPIGKGTGLGLSISKSIIEKHNGKISVQSDKEHGTVFSVILPAVL